MHNKVVIIANTMHHNSKIDDATGEEKKSEMVTDHNLNKGGIDAVDKLCREYSVQKM